MKSFRRINSTDQDLMKVQNSVEQVLNPLTKLALLDGTFLVGLNLTTQPLKVGHNLTRLPLGWFLTDQDTNAVVYRSDWTTTTISLQASAPCTVSLWIF